MKIFFLLLSLSLITTPALAQPTDVQFQPLSLSYGKMLDWYSPIVGDSFRTYVFVPPGYDTSSSTYPVLYLTDGDWLFTTAVHALGSLKQDYQVREPIIIAIGYGDRDNKRFRDLDPDMGGAAFLRSLKEEVMPWVKRHFKVNQEQLLYGYSMGGKFATFALFCEPTLFSSVMVGAPADGGTHLLPTARKYAEHLSKIQAKVFMGAGEYEHETVDNINKFRSWCKQHVAGTMITCFTAPKMNHGAAISAVIQEALRVNFATLQNAITVPVPTLERYTGVYMSTTDPAVSSKVFLRDSQLYISLHGYSKNYALRLYPTSRNTFFLKEFERNSYIFSPNGLRILVGNGSIIEMNRR